MTKSEKPEITFIEVPNPLQGKVRLADDADANDIFDAADRAIKAEAVHYKTHVKEDLTALAKVFRQGETDTDRRLLMPKELFGIVHNMKGQGKSFGYDLISRIGASMCDYLRQDPAPDDAFLKVARAHIDALAIIIDNDVKGDGGDVGDKLVDRLASLVSSTAS